MIGLRKRLEYAESTQFQREYIVVRVKCDSKVRKTDGGYVDPIDIILY